MMEIITFEIPGEPVAKGRPRFGQGRTYTPEKTRQYEAKVKHEAMKHAPENPLSGPLEVRLVFYRPMLSRFSRKKQKEAEDGLLRPTTRPDADNLAKSILDPMNGIIFEDDSQVVTLIAEKYYSTEPRVFVEIIQP